MFCLSLSPLRSSTGWGGIRVNEQQYEQQPEAAKITNAIQCFAREPRDELDSLSPARSDGGRRLGSAPAPPF